MTEVEMNKRNDERWAGHIEKHEGSLVTLRESLKIYIVEKGGTSDTSTMRETNFVGWGKKKSWYQT